MDKHSRQKLLVAIALSFSCLSLSVLPLSKGWAQTTETEVSIYIQQLKEKNNDPQERSRAAFVLGRIGGEQAEATVPALKQALQDQKNPTEVRSRAAYAIGRIGGEQAKAAIPELKQALQDQKNPAEVRLSAADALWEMVEDAKDAIPELKNALNYLKEPDENVRYSAASALGDMRAAAKDAVPELREALKDPVVLVRRAAADALLNIADYLEDEADELSLEDLDTAISEFKKALKIVEEDKQNTFSQKGIDDGKKILSSLEGEKGKRQFIYRTLKNHPWSAAIVIVPVLYLGVLGLRPQWLLLLPAEFTIPQTKIKLTPQILLVLKYRPRVLDAWVTAHIDSARKGFQKKTTVSDRAIYIPIPVVLDRNNVANFTGKDLQPTFADKRCCLLIWGEGGAGKTSLACQLAKWAMSDDVAERLCKHRMLPVLIEQELNFEVAAGKKAFTEMIRGQFQALIGEADAIPDELLDRLLRQRRILVIVDHLSEMSAATRKEIQPGHPDFPANALIVTSRLEEKLDDVPKTVIKPLRIEGNRLSSFMEAYLTQRGKRDLFTDSEFFDACSRLSLMVGQRNITILLAKLYAEQMISAKEGATEIDLPDNIPDLMLSYLNELNRDAADNEPNNRTVQRDAKAIAWECLKQTYHPSAAKRDDVITVLAALNGNDNTEAHLQYLERRLRLIQTIGSAQDKIRFALDPLAEYLAGLHIVEHYNDNEAKWREFLVQADSKPNLEAIKGFLLAVRDCCLAKGTEARVPDFVAEELSKHSGLVTKVEQAQLAQSLVNNRKGVRDER